LLTLLALVPVFSQDWQVPADRQRRLSTFAFNDSIEKAGLQLYKLNCMSCHGTPGMGNYQPLVPPPGDPATEKIQHNLDGEIFFKISEGRGQMPSFKNTLSTGDIWNLVAYIRSFNSGYVQSVMPEITSGAYPGALITISLRLASEKGSVIMKVSAIKDNTAIPVIGAGVKLFIKRTFGMMTLGEEEITDNNGIATFGIPPDLQVDTAGNIHLSARFMDEEKFGSIAKDTILQAGLPVVPVSLVKDRAMWNTLRKAPLWILLTYGLGVILVWGFIILVMLKLRDIFIIGEFTEKEQK
jgi:cytochrome c553